MTPDWLPLAHRVHVAGMAAGTALLVCLAWRMVHSGLARRYPCFVAFLAVAICRAIQGFVGIPDLWYPWCESATMAAKGLAVLEGFVKLFPRPRVPTLGLLGAIAAILAGITLLLPEEPNQVREFERYRTAAHVGLAGFCAAGLGWLWIRPRAVEAGSLAYWRIWTAKLACAALVAFVNYQAAPDDLKWPLYYVWAAGHLIPTCATYALFIRWAGRDYGGVPGG